MQPYETETIRMIRALNSRLNNKGDTSIADMYKEWCATTASADLLTPIDKVLQAFVNWAISAPCDNYNDVS